MRHKSRICHPPQCIIALAVLIFSFQLITTQIAHGQTPSTPSSQTSDQRVASPALPTAWSDGVKALAGKIAAAVKPSRAISLEMKNISSLGAADMEVIRAALDAELQTQGLRIGSADAHVEVTLSENGDGYVWVAETRRNAQQENSPRVAIVSVSKVVTMSTGGKTESLALSKRLVWQQPIQFLDFLIAERPTTVMSSSLMILEADRLIYYRSTTPQWELWQEIPLPHVGHGNRAFQGRIDASFQRVWGPGGECSGNLVDPATVKCSPNITILAGAHVGVAIPGHEMYQGELLSERCGDKSVALVSGNGDWTEPDSLQGYLYSDVVHPDAVLSGGPIEFDGPIMSMQGDDRESVRVIVRNLKTGNYEGYIVTATCSR
jgi:hypothetical protein